jgi:SAM-dependent methyltransferase
MVRQSVAVASVARVRSCRACGLSGLTSVLDLGRTPLANRLLDARSLDASEPTFPLELVHCGGCSLVQIGETVPPEELFRDYAYFSSYSETMLAHARDIAERMIDERQLDANSLAVELASNDGYLLKNYVAAGVPALGIEPAENVAAVARARHGVETISEFFDLRLAQTLALQGRRADVIHANNVLAHVADLEGFVAGIAALLRSDGQAVLEFPYLKEMLDRTEFDTIYHEHLCYFSLTAVERLFRRHGLEIVDVERIAIHGGSLRIFAEPIREDRLRLPSVAVQELLREERRWRVDAPESLAKFALDVKTLKADLTAELNDLKRAGKRIAAYGASAKGSTLLNVFGIGRETLDFVVDRSDVKQGRYTPGTHLPILPPSALLERMPDVTLLLTWNFADEILAQQAAYRAAGGKFLIPLPQPTLV